MACTFKMESEEVVKQKQYYPLVPPKDFKLYVIWDVDEELDFQGFVFRMENMVDPQLTDLQEAMRSVCDDWDRDRSTLYARYTTREFLPITDYLTMKTAFLLMELHNSNLLYLVKRGEPIANTMSRTVLKMSDPSDITTIMDLFGHHEVTVSLKQAKPEHIPKIKEPEPPPPPVQKKTKK